MKILLAADGSPFTQIASRHLVSFVRGFAKPPEVHIVHVHPQIPYPGAAAVAGKSAVQKYLRDESLAALKVAEKELAKEGIDYTSAWVVGDVAEELARYVKAHGIALVVMGTHGHGALANLALGSVATKCIATLDVPILVVRKAPAKRAERK